MCTVKEYYNSEFVQVPYCNIFLYRTAQAIVGVLLYTSYRYKIHCHTISLIPVLIYVGYGIGPVAFA